MRLALLIAALMLDVDEKEEVKAKPTIISKVESKKKKKKKATEKKERAGLTSPFLEKRMKAMAKQEVRAKDEGGA